MPERRHVRQGNHLSQLRSVHRGNLPYLHGLPGQETVRFGPAHLQQLQHHTQCQADTVYGNKSVCVSSQCVAGTCAATADCKAMGRLCPTATKVCTECTSEE